MSVSYTHLIISHSMGHGRYDEMSAADVVADATAAKTYLETQLCVDTAYIRPPYGACGEQTSAALRQAGFVPVRWSVDSMDWKGEDAGAVTSRVISAASPGGIVVFQNNQENTVAALPDIIDKLKDLGYGFSSVSQMVLRENYALSDAGQQSPQQAAEGE